MKINRRAFLRSLGIASGAMLLPRSAWADGHESPERLLIVIDLQGTVYPEWKMRPRDEPNDVDYEFALSSVDENDWSPILRPLHRHARRMTVLDGVGLLTAALGVPEEPHTAAAMTLFTGSGMDPDSGGFRWHPSLDRTIAEQLRGNSRVGSIDIGPSRENTVLYQAAGQPLVTDEVVAGAWRRIFGVQSEYARTLFERGMEREVRAAVGPATRARLEDHFDLLRQIGAARIDSSECLPSLPEPGRGSSSQVYESASLIASAFACDVTRVATLQLLEPALQDLGISGGDLHTDFAHSVLSNPRSYDVMTTVGSLQAERFAAILDLLDSVEDGDGSLLDHTTVVWVNELANSAHGFEPLPVVVAGGRKFAGDRYLRYAPTVSGLGQNWQERVENFEPNGDLGAVPHQHFLVSLAQAFGIRDSAGQLVEHVGLTHVEAQNGRIDLRGALPRF
jgi:hypothetical protein